MTKKLIEALAAALKDQQPIEEVCPEAYAQWCDDVNAVARVIPASFARALFLELVQAPTKGPIKGRKVSA